MAAIHEILKKFWGYDSFRSLQQEIIEEVLAGKDTLALMPTSAGKSICFQIPALAKEGICIVITPLIALMKNQVENLRKRGIKAEAIYSGMHSREIDTILDNCIYGSIKFLYVSPERLNAPIFIERAKRMNINLLAVDEAHCISQWGYDFRPAYLNIVAFKNLIPKVTTIALTASATEEVAKDIIEKLSLENTSRFRLSFERKNISYSVLETEDKDQKLIDILQKVTGTSIIYVRSRMRAKNTSNWLNSHGFNCDFYHAGLSNTERNTKQDNWIKGKTTTIVATNAFGMGIDKSNVRLVIHLDLPESLEAYYQEAGRAGRDEIKAFAVILYNKIDAEHLSSKILESYPPIDFLRRLYQMLANYYHLPVGVGEGETFSFNASDFTHNFDVKSTELFNGLKLLENEGFILMNEAYHNPSKIQIIVNNAELYNFRLTHEKLDSLIKLLLRMYGGELFSDLITISESQISQKFMLPEAQIYAMLELLAQQKIILYIKQNNLPTITYLQTRHDAKLLPISEKNIFFRKNRDISKAQAMIDYASNYTQCRSSIILQYFDESPNADCGICDVCIGKKRAKRSNLPEIEKYKTEILSFLRFGKMSPDQLKNKILPKKTEIFIQAIQLLLEEGAIKYNATGELFITI